MLTSVTSFDANSVVSVVPNAGHDGPVVTIPDAQFLFHADFTRTGPDLTLTGEDGQRLTIADYFRHERLPTLLTPDGAALTGDVVEALVGAGTPQQYAQAGGAPAPSDAQPIGRVASVSGNATAVRNGVSVALNVGDAVYKGDVIQTGATSAVGVIFGDASTFNLTSNARMVLNEFVYNPAPGSANSAFINLVQGSITFIAGEVAHTGDMKVGTPVATMGIRGTAVQVDINVNGSGQTQLSVLVEPGGRTGSFNIYSLSGNLIGTVNNANGVTIVTPVGPLQAITNELQKTPAELAQALAIMQQVFQTQAVGQAILAAQPIPPSGPTGPTQQGPGDGGQQNTGPLTTIQALDMSSVHVSVDVLATPGETRVEVSPLPAVTPIFIPLILAPTPIPVLQVQQTTTFLIEATQTSPLIEATQVSPGVSAAVTVLTVNGNSPTFDIAALLAANWQDIGGGVFIKTGKFGTAALSTSTGTVTYILDNDKEVTQALRPGDVESDAFAIPLQDASGATSHVVSFTVNGRNDAPVVVTTDGPVPHIQTVSQAASAIDAGVKISDVDSTDLAGATVTISVGAQSGDTLTIDGTTSGSVTVGGHTIQFNYDSTSHALSLSGDATLADYEAVLRTVSFSNTGDNVAGSTRTIAFQVDDGAADDNISDVATATIVVNHLPDGVADVGSATADAGSTVVSGNVLTNDTDIDSADTHTVSAVAGATDNGSTFTVAGTYGTLVIDKATGAYTYTLANGQTNVQALAEGQTVTDVFTYTNVDNHGGSASSILTINVTGSNDEPVAVADIGSVSENAGSPVVSGNLLVNDTDIDSTDTHTVSAVANATDDGATFTVVGTYGTLVIDKATGAYTYTLANGQANVRALAEGQTAADVFNYTNADNHGGSASSTLTISITGSNDGPVAVADVGSVTEDGPTVVSGNVLANDTDVDSADTHTVSAAVGATDNGTTFTVVGIFGTLVIDKATGAYTYTLATGQANVQALADGQIVTDVFNYTNTDNNGASGSATLTISIHGTNDAPVLANVGPTGTTTEAVPTLLDTNVAVSDAELDSLNGGLGNYAGASLQIARSTDPGTHDHDVFGFDTAGASFTFVGNALMSGGQIFAIFSHPTGPGSVTGILTINFTGQQTAATTALVNDVIDHITYTNDNDDPPGNPTLRYTFNDGNGGTSNKTIAVSLTKVNDAPDLTPDTPAAASYIENAQPTQLLATGAVSDPDIDLTRVDANRPDHFLGGNFHVQITGGLATGDQIVLLASSGFTVSGGSLMSSSNTVGTISGLGTADVHVTGFTNFVTPDVASQLARAFGFQSSSENPGAGDRTVTFTFNDGGHIGSGGALTDTVTQVVHITPVNDPAVIAGDLTGDVTDAAPIIFAAAFAGNGDGESEGQDPTAATGALTASDVDNPPNTFQVVATPSPSDHYGYFTITEDGHWSYTLDTSNADVRAAPDGDLLTDTFTVHSVDGTAQQISITIHGTNDPASIDGDGASGSVTEDGTLTTGGTLTVSDVDTGESEFQAPALNSLAGVYGTFSFDPTSGVWDYTLANGQSNVQALAADTTVYDTLVVTSFDGTATQTIEVAINGANDAPVLALSPTFSVTDQFPTQNYGLWSEANDGGSAAGGEFQLAHDSPEGNPSTFQIRLTDFDSEVGVPDTLSRTIDLSGLTSAIVTFDYRRDIPNGETDDRFLVLASSDGVNFTQIGNIGAIGNGGFVDPAYQTVSFDLTSFISTNTTIRFSVGDDVDDGDVVYVDNITFASAPSRFTEGGAPVSLGLSSLITDVDNTDMQSARIVLSNAQDGDSLFINGAPGSTSGFIGATISYTVTAASGSITIDFDGVASIADYQAAINSIRFSNNSDDPSTTPRAFAVTVNDGAADSNTVAATINVTAVNDVPVTDLNGAGVLGNGNAVAFTEQTPVLIAESATISDVDSTDLASMTVRLTSRPNGSAESLSLNGAAATAAGGLAVSYSSANGVLSISGTASLATYQDILQGILYDNTSDTPSTANRSITVVVNDGEDNSVAHTVTLSVTPVNDAPVIIAPSPLEYWTGSVYGDVAIVNQISFADVDAGNDDVRATLRVSSGALSAESISNDGVTVSQGFDTSVVTLSGSTADINAYIAGNHVLFNPPGTSLDDRSLTVTINDLGNNGGPAQSATTNVTLHSHPLSTSSSASSTFDLHAISLNVSSVVLGDGNDTLTTSSSHLQTTTYDGGLGSDSVTLVFTPEQLSQILSSSSLRGELQDYLDGTPGSGSATLDLSGSDWNAVVRNFEHASVALATGSQIVNTGITDLFPASLSGPNGNGFANLLVATSSGQTLNGNSGNDILVARSGGDTLNGGNNNDILLGNTGNDTLQGGTGNDILFGARGADTFVFTETSGSHASFGQDHVLDFQVGEDVIRLEQSVFNDFASVLTHAHQTGGDVVITADVSNTVTLHNVNLATLHASNFQLV